MKTTSHLKSTISPIVSFPPYFVSPHCDKGVRKMRKILFVFGIAFLGIVNAANATCPDGAERPCMINGRHGTQTCVHFGWSPCIPYDETPGSGKVHPKYYVLLVIYAPPGTQGGLSTSSVTY